MAGGVAQALPTDHTGAFAEENTFSSEITVSADIRFSQENASVNTPPEIKVSSEGLFKAKAVKEVDAERDCATPAGGGEGEGGGEREGAGGGGGFVRLCNVALAIIASKRTALMEASGLSLSLARSLARSLSFARARCLSLSYSLSLSLSPPPPLPPLYLPFSLSGSP